MDVICRTTGMGFAAIARVTDDKWVTCTVKDDISFGLQPGDELSLETTICREVKNRRHPIVIEDVEEDTPGFVEDYIPKKYGFRSHISVPIIRKNGSFFGTLCAIHPDPARIDTPEIINMFELFADLISFHLNAIEEIEATTGKLKDELQHSELREQFIAILGHDLRNPIATTRMSADIILKVSQDELVQRQASMIKSTSYRMDTLIENILDFAMGRLGEGITLQKSTNNDELERALQQVLKEMRTISPEREFKTKFELREPVNCDPERVAQLFSNLLGNAETHGDPDKPITSKAVSGNGEFQVEVSNAGTRIPMEAQKHLFSPFYREDHKRGKRGLGLGLFIATEIARAHAGKMEIDSTDEKTTFRFRMPL